MLVDPIYHHVLTACCLGYYPTNQQLCHSYITYEDSKNVVIMVIVLPSLTIMLLCSARQMQNVIIISSLMIMTSWLLARCCDTIYIWYEVDIFTVYLLVWQFVCLIHKWIHQDLPYLSFTLHQKACCLYMAFLAFIMHDVALKYLPTHINFALLWVMSIVDIITCLHPRWRMDDPITKALVHAVSFDYPTVP
ncbi:unnamed protein product [Rotaria sordida]|uniref:Uncharacterized protein n=1 Tax=Rotaria sordida TaxID=392033 RepID=A0A815C541_9BILA|nr:unnamed protein product [Rotaria sordida]